MSDVSAVCQTQTYYRFLYRGEFKIKARIFIWSTKKTPLSYYKIHCKINDSVPRRCKAHMLMSSFHIKSELIIQKALSFT